MGMILSVPPIQNLGAIMDEKTIERIYGATERCKLFVSPTRISIRFKKNISPEEADRVERFLLKAATKVDCETTVRGHLARHATDTLYIVLKNESRNYSIRILESDVEDE